MSDGTFHIISITEKTPVFSLCFLLYDAKYIVFDFGKPNLVNQKSDESIRLLMRHSSSSS